MEVLARGREFVLRAKDAAFPTRASTLEAFIQSSMERGATCIEVCSEFPRTEENTRPAALAFFEETGESDGLPRPNYTQLRSRGTLPGGRVVFTELYLDIALGASDSLAKRAAWNMQRRLLVDMDVAIPVTICPRLAPTSEAT
jgi:hypothetical protein